MSGHPKWYSTAKSDRKRKPIELTLPDDVILELTKAAKKRKISRSAFVEELIRWEVFKP